MNRLFSKALLVASLLVPIGCTIADATHEDGASSQDPLCPNDAAQFHTSYPDAEGIACRYEVGCVIDVISVPRDSGLCTSDGCHYFRWERTEEHTCVPCTEAGPGDPCELVGETCEHHSCYSTYRECLPDHTWEVEFEGDPTCV